jgi:hypothetical protein
VGSGRNASATPIRTTCASGTGDLRSPNRCWPPGPRRTNEAATLVDGVLEGKGSEVATIGPDLHHARPLTRQSPLVSPVGSGVRYVRHAKGHTRHEPNRDRVPTVTCDESDHLMDISITDEQAELLREVLDRTIRDLRYEISDTDRPDFKRMLKAREATLRELIAPLGGTLPDAPMNS